MKAKVAVLGSGSWGTALAILLARNGVPTLLWGREAPDLIDDRENKTFLPGIIFPDALKVVTSFDEAVTQAEEILIAVPSAAFSSILDAIAKVRQLERVAWATKGLDHGSSRLLSELVVEAFPSMQAMALISGPSFAKEVAEGVPSALTVASTQSKQASSWCEMLCADDFQAVPSDDIIGVQIASAVKNVIAIASGIIDGMGHGANTRCALITQGLTEMKALAIALGAKEATFMSLAGIGDLMLTATDDQSRNRRFGLALGRGQLADEAEAEIRQVVEGRETCLHVAELAKRHQVSMPIVETLDQLFKGQRVLADFSPLWFMPSVNY